MLLLLFFFVSRDPVPRGFYKCIYGLIYLGVLWLCYAYVYILMGIRSFSYTRNEQWARPLLYNIVDSCAADGELGGCLDFSLCGSESKIFVYRYIEWRRRRRERRLLQKRCDDAIYIVYYNRLINLPGRYIANLEN